MRILFALFLICAAPAQGATKGDVVADVVDGHIIAGFADFAAAGAALSAAAAADCAPEGAALRSAYHAAFDAWMGVGHLAIGPMETTDLGFAIHFWPDPRAKTVKALKNLIAAEDPVVDDPAGFAAVSVAGRGLLAMDRLLVDDLGATPGYRCRILRAVATDLAVSGAELLRLWREDHGPLMGEGGNAVYPDADEALRKLYTTLMTAIMFNADARVARPLGTVRQPRPKRAEAWRTGRSLRNLELSTRALRDLAMRLAEAGDFDSRRTIGAEFDDLFRVIEDLDQPVFDGPGAWIQIDILRQTIELTRDAVDHSLGADLGLFVGFNARDGD